MCRPRVVGLVWGFLDALVGGAVLAWIYNLIATLEKQS